MKIIIKIALFLMFTNLAISQVTQEWMKTYFNYSQFISGQVIALDSAGNVIVAGQGGDISWLVIKYNSSGTQLWLKKFYPGSDFPQHIAVDKNGNIYLAGTTGASALLKLSANGDSLWLRNYPQSGAGGYKGLIVTPDNCPIVTGNNYYSGTRDDIITVKYNTNGDTLWTARYNSVYNRDDRAASIALGKDGSVLVAGVSYFPSYSAQFLTLKYDSTGVLKWERRYGSSDSINGLVDGTFDNNGNVYVTGELNEIAYCTIKYNANGDFKWAKTYSNSVSSAPFAIKADNNGNVIVTGNDFSPIQRFVTSIKYDSLGNQLWINNLSQISPNYTGLNNRNSTKIDYSNNIYLTGTYNIISSGSQLGMFTAKINSNGILDWYKVFYGNLKQDGGSGIVVDKYNNVFSVGTTQDSLNGNGIVTIKYSQPTGITQIGNEIPNSFKLFQNYPNPFNPSTVISYQLPVGGLVTLKIYDMLGREIETLINESQNAGIYKTTFVGQGLASGIYLYELKVLNNNSNIFREVKRMVFLK